MASATTTIRTITPGDFPRIGLVLLLQPALHRLEKRRWLRAEWAASDTGREARFYSLTRLGRRQLEARRAYWDRLSAAISGILRTVE